VLGLLFCRGLVLVERTLWDILMADVVKWRIRESSNDQME
jgi:hypothetical protein